MARSTNTFGFKLLASIISLQLVVPSNLIFAAPLPYMPEPSQMIVAGSKYDLPRPIGLKLDPKNPLRFEFILDKGDYPLDKAALAREAKTIGEYFLAALTVPEKDLWVNLSPYEKNRISTPTLAKTTLGQDMLGTDYVLKQLSASLTYPETEAGKKYWQASDGSSALQKVWVVPGAITVYENPRRALIGEATLKAMVNDIDTKSMSNAPAFKQNILPLIEQELNSGKHFARLRQLYNSIILANWFKAKLKDTIFNSAYFNQGKTNGVNVSDPAIKQKIYDTYIEAFKKGAYSYTASQASANKVTKRTYFCGGESMVGVSEATTTLPDSAAPEAVIDKAGSAPVAVVDAITEGGALAVRGPEVSTEMDSGESWPMPAIPDIYHATSVNLSVRERQAAIDKASRSIVVRGRELERYANEVLSALIDTRREAFNALVKQQEEMHLRLKSERLNYDQLLRELRQYGGPDVARIIDDDLAEAVRRELLYSQALAFAECAKYFRAEQDASGLAERAELESERLKIDFEVDCARGALEAAKKNLEEASKLALHYQEHPEEVAGTLVDVIAQVGFQYTQDERLKATSGGYTYLTGIGRDIFKWAIDPFRQLPHLEEDRVVARDAVEYLDIDWDSFKTSLAASGILEGDTSNSKIKLINGWMKHETEVRKAFSDSGIDPNKGWLVLQRTRLYVEITNEIFFSLNKFLESHKYTLPGGGEALGRVVYGILECISNDRHVIDLDQVLPGFDEASAKDEEARIKAYKFGEHVAILIEAVYARLLGAYSSDTYEERGSIQALDDLIRKFGHFGREYAVILAEDYSGIDHGMAVFMANALFDSRFDPLYRVEFTPTQIIGAKSKARAMDTTSNASDHLEPLIERAACSGWGAIYSPQFYAATEHANYLRVTQEGIDLRNGGCLRYSISQLAVNELIKGITPKHVKALWITINNFIEQYNIKMSREDFSSLVASVYSQVIYIRGRIATLLDDNEKAITIEVPGSTVAFLRPPGNTGTMFDAQLRSAADEAKAQNWEAAKQHLENAIEALRTMHSDDNMNNMSDDSYNIAAMRRIMQLIAPHIEDGTEGDFNLFRGLLLDKGISARDERMDPLSRGLFLANLIGRNYTESELRDMLCQWIDVDIADTSVPSSDKKLEELVTALVQKKYPEGDLREEYGGLNMKNISKTAHVVAQGGGFVIDGAVLAKQLKNITGLKPVVVDVVIPH